jgi:hypothetical protein
VAARFESILWKRATDCTVGAKSGSESEFITLYRRAFADYALWSLRAFDAPTLEDRLVVARAFSVEGDMGARLLAEELSGLAAL